MRQRSAREDSLKTKPWTAWLTSDGKILAPSVEGERKHKEKRGKEPSQGVSVSRTSEPHTITVQDLRESDGVVGKRDDVAHACDKRYCIL